MFYVWAGAGGTGHQVCNAIVFSIILSGVENPFITFLGNVGAFSYEEYWGIIGCGNKRCAFHSLEALHFI
jgi:hypothetical protein